MLLFTNRVLNTPLSRVEACPLNPSLGGLLFARFSFLAGPDGFAGSSDNAVCGGGGRAASTAARRPGDGVNVIDDAVYHRVGSKRGE